MEPVLARWDRSADLAKHGVSFFLYGLLDVIVDGYFETVQAFDDYYDEVSEGIFSEQPLDPSEQRRRIFGAVAIGRVFTSKREVISEAADQPVEERDAGVAVTRRSAGGRGLH